ncbi:unnamed protein product, partial [Iphiclides podalirius]
MSVPLGQESEGGHFMGHLVLNFRFVVNEALVVQTGRFARAPYNGSAISRRASVTRARRKNLAARSIDTTLTDSARRRVASMSFLRASRNFDSRRASPTEIYMAETPL